MRWKDNFEILVWFHMEKQPTPHIPEGLSKREKKEYLRRWKQEVLPRQQEKQKLRNLIIAITALLIFGALGWWLWRESSQPLPGTAVADLGRDHVAVGTKVSYNSNPPTSGPHYAEWEKAGIYDKPLQDGKLVHSLEHGYVIISYNCENLSEGEVKNILIPQVFAHGDSEQIASPSSEITADPKVERWKNNSACQRLVEKLVRLANGQRLWKLIVVPRPNLDTHLALTAWGRIDKFAQFDETRIKTFIKRLRDKGPEQTME